MKTALLIGGPADGQVKTVDNGLTVLWAADVLRPSICDACGIDRAAIIRPVTKARYVEVLLGEQRPLRVFKLETLQDDDVLHLLADFYARVHEERYNDPCGT